MRQVRLVEKTTIGAAVTRVISQVIDLPRAVKSIAMQSKFLFGAAGTNLKVWYQTSFDNGETWRDMACHAFLVAALNKASAISSDVAAAVNTALSDGALADDTIVQGLIGSKIRAVYTSTGTYTGATSIQCDAVIPD